MEAMVEGGGGIRSEMRENGDERLDGGGGPKFSRRPFFDASRSRARKKLKRRRQKLEGGTDVCKK